MRRREYKVLIHQDALPVRLEDLIYESVAAERGISLEEARSLIKDLKIHQAELAMCKEENSRIYRQLKDALERYQELYDSCPVGCLILEADGKIIEANLKIARMLAEARSELTGKNFADFIAEESRLTFQNFLHRLSQSTKSQSCRIILSSGKEVDCLVRLEGQPLKNYKKGTPLFHISVTDINPSRQQELNLPFSEDIYRRIVETADQGIWISDPHGRTLYVNQKMAEMLGYTREELIGRQGLDFLEVGHTDTLLKEACGIEDVTSIAREYKLRRKDGSSIWTLVNASPLFDEQGRYIGNLSLHTDITERKRLEEALARLKAELELRVQERTSELDSANQKLKQELTEHQKTVELLRESTEFNSTLLTNAPNPVLVTNPDSSIKYINPALEKLTGYSREELIGKKAPHPWWPEDKSQIYARQAMESLNKKLEVQERWYRKKNGELFCVSASILPIEERGEVKYYLMNWVDITHRKQYEEEIRKSHQKLAGFVESIPGVAFEFRVMSGGTSMQFTYLSARVEELFGIRAESLLQNPKLMLDIMSPQEFREFYQSMLKAFEKKSLWKREFRIKLRNGKIRWIQGRANEYYITPDGTSYWSGTLIDITEQKEAEDALRESEERYRNLFETINQGIVYHDGDGRVIALNPAAEKILGLSLDDMKKPLEASGWEIFREDGSPMPMEQHPALVAMRTGKEVRDVIFGFLNPVDGRRHWINVSAVPEFKPGESGKPYRVYTNFTDITKRKEAEDKLKESEEFNRNLLENAPNPIVVINPDNSIRYVNPAFLRLTGFSEEEIIGRKPPFPYWPPEFHDQYYRAYMDPSTCKVEWIFQKKNGERFWAQLNSMPVKKEDQIKYHICAWIDITERRHTEDALKQLAEFNEVLLDNAPDQIMVLNPDTSIRYVNREFIEKNGWQREEVLGMKAPYPWWPAEQREQLLAGFLQCFNTPTGEGELISQKKNGERYWLHFKWSSIIHNGRMEYMIINATDITERNKAEEALKESEEHFRLLTGKSPLPIVVNREDGEIEYINEQFTAQFGYSLTDFPNRESWWQQVYPDKKYRDELRENWRRALARTVAEGKSVTGPLECLMTCKDGRQCVVEISSTRVGNKQVVVFNDITERRKIEEDLKKSIESVQKALRGTVDAAAKMVEMRDPYTAGHQQRVAKLAVEIARELNLEEDRVKCVGMAAMVHDLGKIYVPAEILSRTGKLSDLEFQMMKVHVQGSYDILKTIEFPWPIAEIVYQHHERMDGSGYPRGLEGDDILLEARILAVADTVEAMSTHRPYRPALGVDEALQEISRRKGTLYDPEVVDACQRVFRQKGFSFEMEDIKFQE